MRKALISLLILGTLVCAGLVSLTFVPNAYGHNGDIIKCAYAENSPKIDGEFDDGEWKDATIKIIAVNGYSVLDNSSSGSVRLKLYFMNNPKSLYIAVEVMGKDYDENDSVMIRFDDPHDGECKDCEDFKFLMAKDEDQYKDCNQNIDMDDAEDKKQNGKGCIRYDLSKYKAEFEIPLDSKDDMDIKADPGDTIGFNIVYSDKTFSDDWVAYGWPLNERGNSSTWGDLVINSAKVQDGAGDLGPIFTAPWFLALIGIIIVVIIILVFLMGGRSSFSEPRPKPQNPMNPPRPDFSPQIQMQSQQNTTTYGCPHCGRPFTALISDQNQELSCPYCWKTVTIYPNTPVDFSQAEWEIMEPPQKHSLPPPPPPPPPSRTTHKQEDEDALEILKIRLANGEIDIETYRKLKKEIE